MAHDLSIALQITVIGMGLVFASILLLWGMMALLVRLTADRGEVSAEGSSAQPQMADQPDLRAQAAAAAVTVALSMDDHATLPAPQTVSISAWQSVMRGRQLRQRGAIR